MTENNLSWADLGLGDMDLSQVEEPEGFEDTIKDGVFQAVTQPLVLGKDEKSGKVYARVDYEIATGEHSGKTFSEMFWDLGNPEAYSRGFLKKRLKSLGLPDDFKGMPDPNAFANIPVVVTRKANKGKGENSHRVFYNVVDVVIFNGEEEPVQPAEAPAQSSLSSFFN